MEQRRIDDVAVADHPADVGGGPIDLARLDAIEILHRPRERDHVAAIVADDALGNSGRPRSVEDIERIGGGDRHAVVDRAGEHDRLVAHLRPIVIAAGDERRLLLRTLQDEAGVGLMAGEPDRLVEQRLVLDDAAGLEAATRGQDHLRLGVIDAGRELVRREAAEHHRMHRADPRAGQHGDHRFRHHRHVEDDAVALLDAEIAQDGGQYLSLDLQAVIGDGALLAGEREIVDDCGLIATAPHDVAIDRVPAGVADAADEPAAVDAGAGIEHLLRRLDPVDGARGLGPETLRVTLPARVDLVVAAGAGIHGAAPRL